MVRHRADGTQYRTQVGSSVTRQRCRHADHDRASSLQDAGVRGGGETVPQHRTDVGVVKIIDMRSTGVQAVDDFEVDVQANDGETGSSGFASQGSPT